MEMKVISTFTVGTRAANRILIAEASSRGLTADQDLYDPDGQIQQDLRGWGDIWSGGWQRRLELASSPRSVW
jgi:hypothetical protein